jgi:hypothetical protein
MPITKINSLVEFMHQSPNVDDLQQWFKNNGIKYNHFDDHSGSKFYPDQVRINNCKKSSITTLLPIPDNIQHFLHDINAKVPENKLMTQNDVSKIIHDYIRVNDLFKPGNDKIIIPMNLTPSKTKTQKVFDLASAHRQIGDILYRRVKQPVSHKSHSSRNSTSSSHSVSVRNSQNSRDSRYNQNARNRGP